MRARILCGQLGFVREESFWALHDCDGVQMAFAEYRNDFLRRHGRMWNRPDLVRNSTVADLDIYSRVRLVVEFPRLPWSYTNIVPDKRRWDEAAHVARFVVRVRDWIIHQAGGFTALVNMEPLEFTWSISDLCLFMKTIYLDHVLGEVPVSAEPLSEEPVSGGLVAGEIISGEPASGEPALGVPASTEAASTEPSAQYE
jgi:hypothetical protein